MDRSYILNELAEEREHYFNAVVPPIMQTSNFSFKTVSDMRSAFADEYSAFVYSRGNNPTVDILRKKLAALDGAEDCLVFNSGAAAIFATVLSQVKAGDHIVSVKKPYTWAQKLFDRILPKFGITITYIDGRHIENFERAILPNTRVIYLESPNSWDFAIQDLPAVASLAKAAQIITICDNSHCSPIYQQPILMGIDLVLQSATKYICGHSDTVAGVLSGSKQLIAHIFESEYMTIGSGIQPFNAWLLLRGLRTLPIRLEQSSRSAVTIVDFLEAHPAVEEVLYPLHPSFDQYSLAKQQMKGAGGLISFVLKTTQLKEVEDFCERLKHFLMAVSWGGHESLVIPRCAGFSTEQFDGKRKDHRMMRMYVGLEDPAYLIGDLQQALDGIQNS